LALLWVVARITLRRNAVAGQLLNPPWPAVDRVAGHAVVGLQLMLVAAHLLFGCWLELARGPAGRVAVGFFPEAFGPAAWLLVAVLALGLLAALWHRWREAEAASSLLLAATVPCLIAGQFVGERAVASALRWGLAVGFVLLSAVVWQRGRLRHCCAKFGAVIESGAVGPRISRALLVATTAVPVLILTLVAAPGQLGGSSPGGPVPGSFFDRLGPEVSYLVPLALVTAGLVGFALREASALYAFGAGLVSFVSPCVLPMVPVYLASLAGPEVLEA